MSNNVILPTDPAIRKSCPITTGVLDYFPLAVAEVAKVSKVGNDQHNPGQPMHWAKGKSNDHADCIPRHLIDRGKLDTDGMRHSAKLAWRALANLQLELEAEKKAQPKQNILYQTKGFRHFYRIIDDEVPLISSAKDRADLGLSMDYESVKVFLAEVAFGNVEVVVE